jgi:VanZ family protein
MQSSYPSPESVPDWPYIDKLLHIAVYALLGALFLRAFKTLRIQHNLKLVMILSILLSSLYGISDEIHQYFVPFRNADFMDALAMAVLRNGSKCSHTTCMLRFFTVSRLALNSNLIFEIGSS